MTKKYTKVDNKTMEVSEQIESKERHELPSLIWQRDEHQREIDRLDVLIDEAKKLGL